MWPEEVSSSYIWNATTVITKHIFLAISFVYKGSGFSVFPSKLLIFYECGNLSAIQRYGENDDNTGPVRGVVTGGRHDRGAALPHDYSSLQKDGLWWWGLKPAGLGRVPLARFYEHDYGLSISVIMMFLGQQLSAFRKRSCSMHSSGSTHLVSAVEFRHL